MKVLITTTAFTEDPQLIEYLGTNWIKTISTYLGYTIIKQTLGGHAEANEKHIHIMTVMDTNEAKIYKTLNKKITDIDIDKLSFPTKAVADDYIKLRKKISFIYEGEQKKHRKKIILYDESSMGYPFKEYTQNHRIQYYLQIGFTDTELHEMRKVANISWLDVKRKKNKHDAEEMAKKENEKNMTDYLKEHITPGYETKTLIRQTMKHIWIWKKQAHLKGACNSVRVASVKDWAISFLYFNNYITEDEIIDLQYI